MLKYGVLLKREIHVLAVRTFVFDLDGVIYRGEQPLPGAVETLADLNLLGHQVYFFTNNATRNRDTFLQKLLRMDVSTDIDHVMTSAYATALYLKGIGASEASVLVVGEHGLREELAGIGMTLVDDPNDAKVDYVVAGLDRKFDYGKLTKAQQAIFRGATFIATNRDSSLPLEEGLVIPGGGAIVAAIEAASGVTPITIGKPEKTAMLEVLKLAGAKAADAVVVGDRLETDILAGNRIGATTFLVLTGISTEADLQTAPADHLPSYVVRSLPEIISKLNLHG